MSNIIPFPANPRTSPIITGEHNRAEIKCQSLDCQDKNTGFALECDNDLVFAICNRCGDVIIVVEEFKYPHEYYEDEDE